MADPTGIARKRRDVRYALLSIIREQEKQTQFSRMLTISLYDLVAQNKRETEKTKKKVDGTDTPKKTKPEPKVKGSTSGKLNAFRPNGFYHAASLDFALGRPPSAYVDKSENYNNTPNPAYTDEEKEEWGLGFGNPLVNPKKDCVYIVRARIDQLRADPMIGGFRLEWKWPNGWSPLDGLGRRHLVEASSNPLYIQRLFLSPSTTITPNGVFRCKIMAWFQ